MTSLFRVIRGPLFMGLLLLLCVSGIVNAASMDSTPAYGNPASSYRYALAHSPLSTGLLMARALHAKQSHFSSSAAGTMAHPNLTCSPAPCSLPNVRASEGGQPVNEDPIVVDGGNPNDLMTGGNDYNCGTIRGFYNSSDGGKTWRHHCSASPLSGGCGDPAVGYDLHGTAYAAGIDSSNGCASSVIGVETSKDNGKTWNAPVVAVTSLLGGLVDKDWLQVDVSPSSPFANTIYISTTQFAPNNNTEIAVAHSNDGGKTWQDVAVDPVQTYPSSVDQFSDLTVGKNGTVYVSWMRCSATSGQCAGTQATFYISRSTDAGKTWSTPVIMAMAMLAPGSNCFYGCLPNTNERVSDIPAIDIDNSTGPNAGHLYTVIYNWTGTFMLVEVATSTNGGNTWGAPVLVAPPSDQHDQFFPWLSVSASGVVGVTWLDRRNDPKNLLYEAFAATSNNGGGSFGKNYKIATKPSNPNNDGFGGRFMGDYTGNYWSGRTLYAAWMDSRGGKDMQSQPNMQDFVGGVKCKLSGC